MNQSGERLSPLYFTTQRWKNQFAWNGVVLHGQKPEHPVYCYLYVTDRTMKQQAKKNARKKFWADSTRSVLLCVDCFSQQVVKRFPVHRNQTASAPLYWLTCFSNSESIFNENNSDKVAAFSFNTRILFFWWATTSFGLVEFSYFHTTNNATTIRIMKQQWKKFTVATSKLFQVCIIFHLSRSAVVVVVRERRWEVAS